jgi:hypothetical protein
VETELRTFGSGAPCSQYRIDPLNFANSCVFGVRQTCSSNLQANWTGDPAVRLESVVGEAFHHQVTSICADSYAPALEGLGALILRSLGNCLPEPIATPEQPECVVPELLEEGGRFSTTGVIPSCHAAGGIKPCWSLATNPFCDEVFNPITETLDRLEVKIDRGDAPEQPGQLLAISCSTLAHRTK